MHFIRSIYDFTFYRKIYRQSFGRSFLYLLTLGLIVYTIGTLNFLFILNRGIISELDNIKNELPNFSFENGIFTIDAPQPVIFDTNHINGQILIIDTTGKTPVDEIRKARLQGVLIEADRAHIYQRGTIQEIPFQALKGFRLNKDTVINFVSRLPMLSGFLSLFLFIFWLPWKLIGVLFLALIGMLVIKLKGNSMLFRYGELMNIAAYAMTVPWIFKLLNGLTLSRMGIGLAGPLHFLAYWAIGTLYMVLAINSIDKGARGEVLA